MNRHLRSLLLLATLTPVIHAAAAADFVARPTITLEGAKAVAEIAVRYAKEHGAPGAAVAIVDAGGVPVYVERLDGTFQNASEISIGKARTAALFGKPTRALEETVNKGRYAMLGLPQIVPFTPLMGGVPLEIGHDVAGAIGVSGAASGAQDDEIATAAAAEFAKRHGPSVSGVTVVPRATVEAGFDRDARLLSGDSFKVEASHRTEPGEAEIHDRDTDIFYVQHGSADLVVGGTVSDERRVADAELRGSGITGGETRHISAGDVVVIPRGVAHRFVKVTTPFNYYVVKTSL